MKLNNRGVSLIEIIISAAVLGIGLVTLLRDFTTIQSGIKNAQQAFEAGAIEREIRTLLSDPASCANSLRTMGPFGVGVPIYPVSALRDSGNSDVFTPDPGKTRPLNERTLYLTEINIENFVPYETLGANPADNLANPRRGTVDLRLTLVKNQPSLGPEEFPRHVLLDVELDAGPPGNIASCQSTLFFGQSLWNRVRQTNHLFTSGLFNYRPVLIGQHDPSDLADYAILNVLNKSGQAGLRLSGGPGNPGDSYAAVILTSTYEDLDPELNMWAMHFRGEFPTAPLHRDFQIHNRFRDSTGASDWSVNFGVDSQEAPKYSSGPQGMVGIGVEKSFENGQYYYRGMAMDPEALLHVHESNDPGYGNISRGRVLISGDSPFGNPGYPSPTYSGFYLGENQLDGDPQAEPTIDGQSWMFVRKWRSPADIADTSLGDFFIGFRSRISVGPQVSPLWSYLSIDQTWGTISLGNDLHLDTLLVDRTHGRLDTQTNGYRPFARVLVKGFGDSNDAQSSLLLRSRASTLNNSLDEESWYFENRWVRSVGPFNPGDPSVGQLAIGYKDNLGNKHDYIHFYRQTIDDMVNPTREWLSYMCIPRSNVTPATALNTFCRAPGFLAPTMPNTGTNDNVVRLVVDGEICATAPIEQAPFSDQRLKTLLGDLDIDMNEYTRIKTYRYRYTPQFRPEDQIEHVGTTTQSLAEVFPELVSQEGYPQTMRTDDLVIVQVAAIQMSHEECTELASEVDSLTEVVHENDQSLQKMRDLVKKLDLEVVR